ncbi:MAG: BMC domain-containing protein [Chloroflexota bacterium]
MTSKAVGLIETIGLVAALEAADSAAKAANVKVLGYENTKGGGRITVKFVGEVGAVKAAVAAGSAAALRVGQVESCLVIPRPHAEIECLIRQIDRGAGAAPPAVAKPEPAAKKVQPAAATKRATPTPPVRAKKPKPAARSKPEPVAPSPPAEPEAPPAPPVEPEPPAPPLPVQPEESTSAE